MKTTPRFDTAITKLYKAFHNDTLNPDDCKKCAVGNLLDHTDSWQYLTDKHGSTRLNYIGIVHQNLGRRFQGYTPLELLLIEASFLKGCGYTGLDRGPLRRPENSRDKETLFNGLCEVVNILCQLDDIPNLMDCTKLFNFEIRPQKELQY